MAISDKLNYLIETKSKFKDRLNSLGAEIIESTTFRNYLNWLDEFYNQSSDKTDLAKNGVVGRTSQESTTGKNLLYLVSQYDYGQNGVNGAYNEKDGSFNITGTATASTNSQLTRTIPLALEAGTYTFSLDHTISKQIYLHFNFAGGSTQNIIIPAGQTQATDTLTADTTGYNIRFSTTNGNTYNETVKMQLESGSSATSWEKFTFGVSPNPDYPQPINNLSGDVAYKVRGKNLFDKNNANILKGWFRDATDEMVLNSVSIDRIIAFEGKPNTTYTISKKSSNRFRVDLYNSLLSQDGTYTFNEPIIKNDTGTSITITTTSTDYYIYIHVYQSSDGDFQAILNSIQIKYGNTPTEYEPYISESFPLSLKSKNLFDITTNTNDKVLASDGTITDDVKFTVSDYIKVLPNTKYTISWIYTSSQGSDAAMRVGYFQSDKTFISRPYNTTSPYTITTPNNCHYIRICYHIDSHSQIQIEEGSTATAYEPYYNIELCNISDYKDQIYSQNGEFYLEKKNGKVVFDGSEEGWNYYSTGQYFFKSWNYPRGGAKVFIKFVSNRYENYQRQILPSDNNKMALVQQPDRNSEINIANHDFTTIRDFKTWLSTHNIEVQYVLITPTTTEITQENYPTLYSQLLAIQEFLTKYKINKEFLLDYSSPEIEY